MVLMVDGVGLETTDEGFLAMPALWNERVAEELARLEGHRT